MDDESKRLSQKDIGMGDFSLEGIEQGLSADEKKVWDAVKADVSLDPVTGKKNRSYTSISKEQEALLVKQGVDKESIDGILDKLNLAISDKVEKGLPEKQKQVLDAIRGGVRPNTIGNYTADVNYAAIAKKIGMNKDEVEKIVWELNKKGIVHCYIIESKSFTQKRNPQGEPYMEPHDTGKGFDSFDVRPWNLEAKKDKTKSNRSESNME